MTFLKHNSNVHGNANSLKNVPSTFEFSSTLRLQLRVNFIVKKRNKNKKREIVVRKTRVPKVVTFCVDLSYLIFRTCLALIKAMTVCMGKDPLAYTAATEAAVINHKVSHVYMHSAQRTFLSEHFVNFHFSSYPHFLSTSFSFIFVTLLFLFQGNSLFLFLSNYLCFLFFYFFIYPFLLFFSHVTSKRPSLVQVTRMFTSTSMH